MFTDKDIECQANFRTCMIEQKIRSTKDFPAIFIQRQFVAAMTVAVDYNRIAEATRLNTLAYQRQRTIDD